MLAKLLGLAKSQKIETYRKVRKIPVVTTWVELLEVITINYRLSATVRKKFDDLGLFSILVLTI